MLDSLLQLDARRLVAAVLLVDLVELPNVLLRLLLEFQDQPLHFHLVFVQLLLHDRLLPGDFPILCLKLLDGLSLLVELLLECLLVPPQLLGEHILLHLELLDPLPVPTGLVLKHLVSCVKSYVVFLKLLILLD